jgi:hypothetical protein
MHYYKKIKMNMKAKFIILIALVVIFTGCEDILKPSDENNRTLEDIYDDAAFAEGLLLNGYVRLPSGSYLFNDVATDDAVSNDSENDYLFMATGQWSSINNPTGQWTSAFAAIQYLNLMLKEADKVEWATTGDYTKEMFNDRLKGEAYGLRALFMFHLLQAHGGESSNGDLLGIPILTEPLDSESDFNFKRNTFEECLQQIFSDLDQAESYLPLDYEDVGDEGGIPTKYAGKTIVSEYNRVFGGYFRMRLSARIVKGIRAKVALLAASPAFNRGTSVSWAEAADAAGEVLDLIGGVSGMASNGGYWYSRNNSGEIDNIASGNNPAEILWRTNVDASNELESDNYPPSLYGDGRINPTQNLVDAYPMANGYPIADANSNYDPNNPYANRDPRLNLYIVVNGSQMGPSNSTIYTKVGETNDGINEIATSTRTGYYMRKLLREDINLDPVATSEANHYVPHIRYTELFMAYAEAANEAWGPDGVGTHGYSARDVIGAIRSRAGIEQPDEYLALINNRERMRELIRNERRLELCFEGFRFWDLRRWKEDLTETAKGMRITTTDNFNVIQVEKRQYDDNMYYGPIPYNEVIKWGITQNAGW